jgi:hypothetical protein
MGGLAAAGDVFLPTHGFVGFVTRILVFAAIPAILYATGFAHVEEIRQFRAVANRARGMISRSPRL